MFTKYNIQISLATPTVRDPGIKYRNVHVGKFSPKVNMMVVVQEYGVYCDFVCSEERKLENGRF